MSMILGMCFGGIITLTLICIELSQRIEKLEKDIEKLLENDTIENGSTTK